ncbi:MAG: DUF354 domain-containing protein [Candidatus Bathyarchaeia archaeon]
MVLNGYIWLDATSGKQCRFLSIVKKKLGKLGYETLLTTREHPDTIPLLERLGVDHRVVGRYMISSLEDKLKASLERELSLFGLLRDLGLPSLSITDMSPDQCAVSFKLRVPLVGTADTVHAQIVNRLCIPLIDVLIASKGVARHFLRYAPKKMVAYNGCDPVAWVRGFKPNGSVLEGLGLAPGEPFALARAMETRATYYWGGPDLSLEYAKRLLKHTKVIYVPRYPDQMKGAKPVKGLIVPSGFVDTLSLAAFASVVISRGTIAGESSLMGTPTISPRAPRIGFDELYRYLGQMGFPLYLSEPDEVVSKAVDMIRRQEKYRRDTRVLLEGMQDPSDIIIDQAKELLEEA